MTAHIALADTSFFVAVEQGRLMHGQAPDRYHVSVITVGELRAGVLVAPTPAAAASRLRTLTKALEVEALPVDEAVSVAWAELRAAMRATGRKLAGNDSWIAATAIAHKLPLATQDSGYDGVPGLDVIKL